MSDVFEKIKKLQEKLLEINEGKVPKDSKDLDDQTLSQNCFVDYRLLPESARADKQLNDESVPADEVVVASKIPTSYRERAEQLDDEEKKKEKLEAYKKNEQIFSDYSNGVLFAVWIIASKSAGGYTSALANSLALNRAFNFLDKKTWVPKIIDEKTYRVGKALQIFLHDVLQEEVIETVPKKLPLIGTEIREPAVKQLTTLKIVLDQRLAVYEAHSPEKIDEAKRLTSLRDQQRKFIVTKQKEFEDRFHEIKHYESAMQSQLQNPNSTKALKEIIENSAQKLEEFKRAHQEFITTLRQWHHQNSNLPDTISIPSSIKNLLDEHVNPPEVVAEWQKIFNNPEQIILVSESIRRDLDSKYKLSLEMTAAIETVGEQLLEEQKAEAEKQYFAQIVPTFVEKLQPAITKAVTVSNTPSFYDPEQLPNDADTCEGTLKELNLYLERYQKEATLAYNDFAANNPPPEEFDSLDTKAYEIAVKEAKKNVLQQQEQKIAEIRDYIKQVQDQLQNLSSEFRNQKLRALRNSVGNLFTHKSEASRQKIQAAAQATRFIEDRYKPALKKINENYSAQLRKVEKKFAHLAQERKHGLSTEINQKFAALQKQTSNQKFNTLQERNDFLLKDITEELEALAQVRKNSLSEAKKALLQYKEVLINHKGIYMPEQIPQQQLKFYLGVAEDQELGKWIDGLYSKAKAASGIRGTFTLLYDYASHYTTVMQPSDFDADLDEVIDHIEAKLKKIDHELAIDIHESNVQSNNPPLAENNLYALRDQFDFSRHVVSLINLKEQKEQKITEWEEAKESYEEKIILATLNQELAAMAHEQTLIEEQILVLDCRLSDLQDKATQTLDSITEQLTALNGAEALEYWNRKESDVAAIDIARAFNTRENHRELSGPDAMKRIADSLHSKEKSWQPEGIIEKIAAEITEIPQTLQQLKEKEFAHFQELKVQKEKLDKKPPAIIKNIEAKKTILSSLVRLAEMQKKIEELQQRRVGALTNETKEALLIDMHHAEAELTVSLKVFDANASADVRTKYSATTRMFNDLSNSKTELQIELLTSLEAESEDLLQKIKGLSSSNSQVRERIDKSIALLENRANTILTHCSESTNKTVGEKLNAVSKKVEELQEARRVIPILNQLDTVQANYEKLVKSATALVNTDPFPLLPSFSLLKKAKELAEVTAHLLKGDHPLISEKLAPIDKVKAELVPLQEKCETVYKDKPDEILTEIAAAYEALNARRQVLHTGLHQFYQKDKRQLYRDAAELNELWTEIKRNLIEHGSLQQEPMLDDGERLRRPRTLQKTIEYDQSIWALLVKTNEPQPKDSLFKDEDKVEFKRARVSLEELYFGKTASEDNAPVGGLFGAYLEERAKTFWFKDAVSSFVALVFQCFNYKTEAQERQEYLQDLRRVFTDYQKDPMHYDVLCEKIDEGKQFKPRSKESGTDYDKTLQSHLSQFREEVTKIHEQNTTLEKENAEQLHVMRF
ncbi:hypothetical protein [Legionella clemsonensis]|uniref:Uncharacterized protein n=1 Tax=Legionella clemsonensis TaxID=1867846 RepID=A0A222P4D5_9GAMM|nr:hypothetical protein [Legionella clemsonensis]ASQ46711.1 hypothetical protein clem_10825 [Legionella clemsonensis]